MEAADNLLHDKLSPQRITPSKTTYLSCPAKSSVRAHGFGERGSKLSRTISPTLPAQPPPMTTSRHIQQQVQDENCRSAEDDDGHKGESSDPAFKIWAKVRRCSGISMSHYRRNLSASTTASVAASVNLPLADTCGVDNRALRRKRPGDTEGGLMMQRRRLAATGSKQSLTDRTNLGTADDDGAIEPGRRRSHKGSSKGRRGSGRWGFGNWWLNG